MIFTIETDLLKEALTSLQVKGKHLTSTGFTNSSLGQYVYCLLGDNTLTMYNGDNTFIASIVLEVEGEKDGSVVIDTDLLLPYLRSFTGNMKFDSGDFIVISNGSRKASIPLVVNHPNQGAIVRMMNMINHVSYQPQPEVLFNFGQGKFEGAFTLPLKSFTTAIKNCELVKSGVYKLDFNEGVTNLSTRLNVQNKYEEQIEPMFVLGEPATIEFSGPLYSFFKEGQLLNFYVKDDFPLLVVSDDRILIKAPYVNG